jgi:D-alanyl-D-alanine carboxypeptidase
MRIDINQDPEIKLRVLLGKVDDLVNKGIPREHPKVQVTGNINLTTVQKPRPIRATQGIPLDIAHKVEQHLHQLRKKHGIPSIVLSISTPKGDLQINSGLKNQETNNAVDQNTQFMIGSTTKLFTATLMMKLIEEGKVNLDDTIAKVLPESKITNADKITVKQLLQHTSDLADPPMIECNAEARSRHSKTPGKWDCQAVVNSLEGRAAVKSPEDDPNGDFRYNNAAYAVLGAMIEKLEGKPIEEVLQDRIAKPLRMNSTQFGMPNDSNMARSYTGSESLLQFMPTELQSTDFKDGKYEYRSSNGHQRFDSTSLHENNQFLPQGGLISNVRDMQTFIKALFKSERIFKRSTVDQMCRDVHQETYPGHGGHIRDYGIGMNIEGPQTEGTMTPGLSRDKIEKIGVSYGHAGNLYGYQADLKYYPEHGISFACTTNLGFHETNHAIYATVKERLFNDPDIFNFLFGE